MPENKKDRSCRCETLISLLRPPHGPVHAIRGVNIEPCNKG